MFNTSQVVVRNQDQLRGLQTFILNPPPDTLLSQFKLGRPVLTWDYPTYQSLLHQKVVDSVFDSDLKAPDRFHQALIFMPKSQAEFNLLWRIAVSHVTAEGCIFLVGEKREGVQTAAKRLKDAGLSPLKLDSARHCQFWQIPLNAAGEKPALEEHYQSFSLTFRSHELKIYGLPGVFGLGRLDEGTKLLLENIGDIPAGRVLDFGCGAGGIGACIKSAQPLADVHMVDVHALALESARMTLSQNQLAAHVYPSDGLTGVEGRFRAIYTNPPFHTGIKTDYRVTTQMIRDARERLEQGGELRLVANAFLHYPDLIQDVFCHCETVASTSKFKVLRAVRA